MLNKFRLFTFRSKKKALKNEYSRNGDFFSCDTQKKCTRTVVVIYAAL